MFLKPWAACCELDPRFPVEKSDIAKSGVAAAFGHQLSLKLCWVMPGKHTKENFGFFIILLSSGLLILSFPACGKPVEERVMPQRCAAPPAFLRVCPENHHLPPTHPLLGVCSASAPKVGMGTAKGGRHRGGGGTRLVEEIIFQTCHFLLLLNSILTHAAVTERFLRLLGDELHV